MQQPNLQPQTAPSQNVGPADRDDDMTRRELANFDRFLDQHPEIAEQLHKDPRLVDNRRFVDDHPALHDFLAAHPRLTEEFKEQPDRFMHAEERYDRREDQGRNPDITRGELATMDRFLDHHPEIAEQLRKDPRLIDNKQFVDNHPALQQFLSEHPQMTAEIREHPNAFMRDEERYDRREDAGMGRDLDRRGLASFNGFLSHHDRIADELSKNPELANNREYLENHSELREYLNQNPRVHESLSENPQGFIKSAQQFHNNDLPKTTGNPPKIGNESKHK